MNKKGQTAFETLFLSIVIITGAILVISLYTSISDDTLALSTARAETNKQLAMQKNNIEINQITLVKTNSDANVIISLSGTMNLDTKTIQTKIKTATKYKNVTITVQ